MPKCEISGLWQMATAVCPHPKYEGKAAGYMTCKIGLKKSLDGKPVYRGTCPNFIPGAGSHDEWCKLRKEKRENENGINERQF